MTDDAADRATLEEWARTRDLALRDALIERYRGLARQHALRYVGRGIEHADLEQVAMIGLINALDRFDPSRGVALSSFASPTIEGVIKRHFRDRGWAVRVPRGIRDLSVTTQTVAAQLDSEFGRTARPDEIAERIGVPVESVIEAMDARKAFRTASFDAPAPGGEDGGGMDPGQRHRELDELPERVLAEELLASLPARERQILELRFFEGLTQSEIGDRVGLSQMHVSRLLRRTLRQLREQLRSGAADD